MLSLSDTTDQIIEHMHSYINRLMTKSFYRLKDWLSEKASKKQHEGILKINAFSVKIKKKIILCYSHDIKVFKSCTLIACRSHNSGFLSIKYFVLRATEKCAQYCSSAERKFVV